MQGKEAYPTGNMNCILMGVVTVFGDIVWDVVNDNDAVKQHQRHKQQ